MVSRIIIALLFMMALPSVAVMFKSETVRAKSSLVHNVDCNCEGADQFDCPVHGDGDTGEGDDGDGDSGDGDLKDTDEDGITDRRDNCPEVANPEQEDADQNGIGDACEEGNGDGNTDDPALPIPEPLLPAPTHEDDADRDGVLDDVDNCKDVANPLQEDADENGVGDACESATGDDGEIIPSCHSEDADEDGVVDAIDNCRDVANPGQEDADENGVGDACEPATGDDGEGEGEDDSEEIIPFCPVDSDEDGVEDEIDNCRDVANPNQEDADANGVGDACEPGNGDGGEEGGEEGVVPSSVYDIDEDGVRDDVDNCRDVANPEQEDADQNGVGDACQERNDDGEDDGETGDPR